MISIPTSVIAEKIVDAIDAISCNVEKSCRDALKEVRNCETSATCQFALDVMNENIELAVAEHRPVCQDTGMVVVFLEIGQEIILTGQLLQTAVDNAVTSAYATLRKSVLDPITRINTHTNAPAVLYTSIVDGKDIKIEIMLKGFGSENMSKVFMLTPADGLDKALECIIDTVKTADSNPCPPIIVGVGLGGTFEKACLMSKHALFRTIGSRNQDATLDSLEQSLLTSINKLHIGAQGFGGDITALGVFIESYPTHISSLPVAINILCHCSRAAQIIISGDDYE